MSESEWFWRMDYCEDKRLPPGDAQNWRQAGVAYRQSLSWPAEELEAGGGDES